MLLLENHKIFIGVQLLQYSVHRFNKRANLDINAGDERRLLQLGNRRRKLIIAVHQKIRHAKPG